MTERFVHLPSAPLDDIMVANAAWPKFQQEHPGAVNTTVGVLLDPVTGKPWQPESVIESREDALAMINNDNEYGYQTQAGNQVLLEELGNTVFGIDTHERIKTDLLKYQALGGTGALSLARETLVNFLQPDKEGKIPLVLDSGWPNHPAIFSSPFAISTYGHLDAKTGAYNHQGALDSIAAAPGNSVLLLQACGYNDDGADRTAKQWDEVLDAAAAKDAVVILDAAYLGLANGFETDRCPVERAVEKGLLTLVCVSTSKNMGLYNERVGALFIANAAEHMGSEQAKNLNQLIARTVRRTTSNPPLLAAKTAGIALLNPQYYLELNEARRRLQANRQIFASFVSGILPNVGVGQGLFTKLLPGGFNLEQQSLLQAEGILALPNSRINLGGMRADQVERVGAVVLRALELTSRNTM